MAFHYSFPSPGAASLLVLCFCMLLLGVHGGSHKLYIVYLGDVKHEHPDDVIDSHHDILSGVLGSKEDSVASMVHNYKHGFSGFAAMLTDEEAEQLGEHPEVISVEPSRMHRATTTRSWGFLGMSYDQMPSNLLQKGKYGEDVIIGVVDSGIWPESQSFSDEGYGPVPSRWKGVCQEGEAWNRSNCNRKLIGARYYTVGLEDHIDVTKDYFSARDINGHGTHVASTAAGSVVEAASHQGLATGFARGGAPHARIAVYKCLWEFSEGSKTIENVASTSTAGLLAAIDDAIHDGVDVLSLSLVNGRENSFGALHAVQKGITVVYGAGNDGPYLQTVVNTAPWVITVAGTKTDRSFPTMITLGNKQRIVGQSIYYQDKNTSFISLIGGNTCTTADLNGTDVRGNVVLCLHKAESAKEMFQNIVGGGAAGLISVEVAATDVLFQTELLGIPWVMVDQYTGTRIMNYIDTDSSPVVKIDPTRTITGKETLAPKVAAFSSRGPSNDYPDVLKPDIAAPGANILAAKKDSFALMSGTSMSTPHVSGIVALLKVVHPDWSPAAVKSAIVTTASVTDERGVPILAEGHPRKIADPFDYGGGHIDPNRAADPGLIYDIDPRDYKYFLACTNNKTSVSCNGTSVPAYHLNLPSISVPELRHPVTISRTVTNVGEVDAVYHAVIQSPAGVKMEVEPSVLVFNAARKVITFQVKLAPLWRMQGDYTFGSLTWQKGQKTVRIPVAARMTIYDFYADVA